MYKTTVKNEKSRKELEEVRKEVEFQMNRLQNVRDTFNQLSRRREELMRRYSTEALVSRLTQLCEQSDAESRELLRLFLGSSRTTSLFSSSLTTPSSMNVNSSSSSSKLSPSDFVSQYFVKRSLFHLRTLKRESLRVLPLPSSPPPQPPNHTSITFTSAQSQLAFTHTL